MIDRKELSQSIQRDPLNLRLWTQLQQSYLDSNDHLSSKSIGSIVAGIAELNERKEKDGLQLTNLQRHAFSRLALAHNNSGLLKEIGIFYLHEFNLPALAIQHFEMAKKFRTSDGDLEALLANAKSALDKQNLQSTTTGSGVQEAKHARPPVKEMLHRTGKLSFHKKTEGIPAVPKDLPQRRTVPAPESSPPSQQILDPGGSTQRLPRKVRTPRVAAQEPEKPAPNSNDTSELYRLTTGLRVEHEGEYYSLEQATEMLNELAYAQRYDSALQLLESIIATSPRTDVGWSAATLLGQACFQQHQYEWARAAFEHASNLIPDEMVSWFNLGLALQNLGRLHEAMDVYQKAEQLQPNHPKVWCNMSALYFQSDQLDMAEYAARKSLEADPTYARAWDNLATALGASGQTEESERAALRAVSYRPDFPEPWLKLGIIYFQQDRLAESEEAFQKAKTLTETSAYALCYLAIILARRGQIESAHAMAQQAAQVDPHCEILWMSWNEIGLKCLQQEDYASAEQAFAQAVEFQPESFQCWYNRALAFQHAGQPEQARDCYRHAVQFDPKSLTGWRSLGLLCRELHDSAPAVEAFAHLVELEPENPATWSEYATALDQDGQNESAAHARTRALEITTRRKAEAYKMGSAFNYLRDNA